MIKKALSKARTQVRQTALDWMCKQLMAASAGGRAPFDFEELKLLRAALVSQNLCCIDGQMVSEFERQFSFAYGVPYGVASTSGTAAIHVALGALDLNPGDEGDHGADHRHGDDHSDPVPGRAFPYSRTSIAR